MRQDKSCLRRGLPVLATERRRVEKPPVCVTEIGGHPILTYVRTCTLYPHAIACLFSVFQLEPPQCFDNPDEGLPVLVHCSVGKSRSTSVVIAYLMIHKGMTFKEAMTLTRSKRARAYPIMHFWKEVRHTLHCHNVIATLMYFWKEVRHTQEHRDCYSYRA